VRIVLIGDSHLARVRRDLPAIGPDVHNAAEGGASSRDLLAQAARAAISKADTVVVSIGTNDAAPRKSGPVDEFAASLTHCFRSVPARAWVYVAPPGVDEARLAGTRDRTTAVVDEYRDAALTACEAWGASVVRADEVIGPLGPDAFVDDGLHLSGRAYDLLLPAIAEAVRATL
jgi:lysophospholipase L1-like esterase